MKEKIRERMFEILKEIRADIKCDKFHCPTGLLIVYSDTSNVLARGAYPIKKTIYSEGSEKSFEVVGHMNDDNAKEKLKIIGEDGAVLVDEEGSIYSPSVYLNVNLFSVDPNSIEDDFCARHIAALATSVATKAHVFTLSEETGKVREFVEGKAERQYPPKPSKEETELVEIIEKDLIREQLKDKLVHVEV